MAETHPQTDGGDQTISALKKLIASMNGAVNEATEQAKQVATNLRSFEAATASMHQSYAQEFIDAQPQMSTVVTIGEYPDGSRAPKSIEFAKYAEGGRRSPEIGALFYASQTYESSALGLRMEAAHKKAEDFPSMFAYLDEKQRLEEEAVKHEAKAVRINALIGFKGRYGELDAQAPPTAKFGGENAKFIHECLMYGTKIVSVIDAISYGLPEAGVDDPDQALADKLAAHRVSSIVYEQR